ncbi:hypothetical protein LCGC14_1835100 [marine sediment metagenome]|uniref:Uncharacterized protein n=1 Tax=marine sediment metagenome TaxID=412755 RepID=A0A0F9JEG6_9ZZZZ
MTNEALPRTARLNAIDMTWFNDDMVGAERGSILKYSGARIVALSSAVNDIPAGILGREKITGDGRTQVPVFIDGIYDCYVLSESAVTVGQGLMISGANVLSGAAAGDALLGRIIGKALEPVDAGVPTTIQVMINGAGN